MVVKKPSGDGKAKNGGTKNTRGKASETSLVDKNGNVLPAEAKGKRDEKCQVKRQGIKSINTTDGSGKGTNSAEIITNYEADDGTIYELDGKNEDHVLANTTFLIYLALGVFWFSPVNCLSYYCNYL